MPPAFEYAGILAFSGAILSYDGSLKYQLPPAPTLFFHGTADQIVSYNKIRFFNKGFYGSSSPMCKNIPEILGFLDKFVMRRQRLQIDLLYNDMEAKPMLTGTAKDLFNKLKDVR